MAKTLQLAVVMLLALSCWGQVKVSGHTGHGGHIHVGGSGTPSVNLSTASLSFANQVVNTTSAAQVLTLTNVGTASLTITSIVTTGNFSNTTTCTGSLAAGANCTISVTFTPLSATTLTGATTITDNAAGSPHVLSLSGTGVTSPPPTTLFSCDFTTCNFSNWGGQNHPEQQSIVTTPVPVGTTHSGQFRYQIAAGGSASQDTNVYATTVFTGQTDVFVKADLYLKTPEADATTGVIISRKLIWLSDSTNPNSNINNYEVLLGGYSGSGGTPTNNFHLTWGSAGVNPACGIPANTAWELAVLNYDTWYNVEFEVKLNTPGGSDGEIHLWINGSAVYSATGQSILRGTCTGNLSLLALGEQSNRFESTTVVDEYRYWTNVFVNTTGP